MKQNTIDFLKEKEANNSRLNITALLVLCLFCFKRSPYP